MPPAAVTLVDLLLTALPEVRAALALSAEHALPQVLVLAPSHLARPSIDHSLLAASTAALIIPA
jgi:hypothetical protein